MREERVVTTYHPAIAKLVGKNAAILLNQIRYWLDKKPHHFDNRFWVYNTYEAWSKQTGIHVRSVHRAIQKLRRANFIVVSNYNRLSLDRTNWYSVNDEVIDNALNLVSMDAKVPNCRDALGQNVMMHSDKMAEPIPVTPTGTPTDMYKAKSSEEVLKKIQAEKLKIPEIDDNPTVLQAKRYWRQMYIRKYATSGVIPPFTKQEEGQFKHLISRCEGKAGIVLRRVLTSWNDCRHHIESISNQKVSTQPNIGVVLSALTYILNWSLETQLTLSDPHSVQLAATVKVTQKEAKAEKDKPIWLKE